MSNNYPDGTGPNDPDAPWNEQELVCECTSCGKTFVAGDEGDNEKYCLRCERESLTEDMSCEDYDDLDRSES